MLIPIRYRDPIQRGEITVMFRRWKRSQVVPGRVYRTAVGRLFVEAVDVVDPARLSARDVRAADLAPSLGRETQPFKLDVRKLKNLGQTISLEVGYRLSPRGAAYLRRRRASEPRPRQDGAAR